MDLDVLCQIAVEGSGRRWLGGLYEATMVVGHCVCKHEEGEGVGSQNPRTEVFCSFSGCIWAACVFLGCCWVAAAPAIKIYRRWGVRGELV